MNTEKPPGNKLHSVTLDIRWSDMDALGHVNNAMYFRYFEITRIAWYDSLGHATPGSEKTGTVIVNAYCEYLRPVVYPASITVTMFGGPAGRSSFDSFYHLTCNEILYTRGSAKVVWLDQSLTRSTPLPASVKALLP